MGKLLLLLLGALVVAGLILAPPPSEDDLFRLGVGELLAGAESGSAPLFDGLVAEGTVPAGSYPAAQSPPPRALVVRYLPDSLRDPGAAPASTAARQADVREAVERAVNFVNGAPPDPEAAEVAAPAERPLWPRLVLSTDPSAPADLDLELEVRTTGEKGSRGLGFLARFHPAGVPDRVVAESGADASFRFPDRTSLLPPLLAIAIAIAFRRVLISLFACVWLAAALLTHQGRLESPWRSFDSSTWFEGLTAMPRAILYSAFEGLLRVFDTFFLNELVDDFRIEILAFTTFLTASVGVMSRSGGMRGLVNGVAKLARGVRGTQFATWLMGIVVFFDDYANCIMVGTTMRPLTDRMRIAREKLAFLVDATAAPVSAVALLSTWVAFEVSTFSAQLPSVGVSESAYGIFVRTIPFRYYALFMIAFVFLSILFQRDFGPMLKAERRARHTGRLVGENSRPMVSDELTRIEPRPECGALARRALVPVLTVLVVTLGAIWVMGGGPLPWTELDGGRMLDPRTWAMPEVDLAQIRQILYDGAGGAPILYGAFTGWVVAMFFGTGLGTRVGLVLGWVLAAQLTSPVANAVLDQLPRRLGPVAHSGSANLETEVAAKFLSILENGRTLGVDAHLLAGGGSGTQEVAAGAALTLADGTTAHAGQGGVVSQVIEAGGFAPVVQYVTFFLLFVACASALGLIASAIVGERTVAKDRADVLAPAEAVRAALASSKAMVLAFCILFLAWMIGKACENLGTAPYLVAQFGSHLESVYWLLPTLLFLTACLVSFSTGSSWSTMGILLPIVVVLSYRVGEAAGVENERMSGLVMMILSIGAVLEGSIFGDHCSPISDTTVLSSTSSASDHIDHVRTQMPYAIVVMLVAIVVGYIPQALRLELWSPTHSLIAGVVVLAGILLVFGRNPNRVPPRATGSGEDLESTLDPEWSPVRGTPDRTVQNGDRPGRRPPPYV